MSKHERFTTAVNDSTGDLIKTKASNQQAYADNWERIFQKPKDSAPKAEQALSRLVDEGVLTDNVVRRHEEQNIGKGKLTQDDVEVSVETPNGKAVVEGYIQEEVEQFIPFEEELLPSGIIGDEE